MKREEIEGHVAAIVPALMPGATAEQKTVAQGALTALAIGFLVDVGRIADALERHVANGGG